MTRLLVAGACLLLLGCGREECLDVCDLDVEDRIDECHEDALLCIDLGLRGCLDAQDDCNDEALDWQLECYAACPAL